MAKPNKGSDKMLQSKEEIVFNQWVMHLFGLNKVCSRENDWARHTMWQCPLQHLIRLMLSLVYTHTIIQL